MIDSAHSALSRSIEAFLELTEDDSERMRALRLLTLHMLEGYAPKAFRRHAPPLEIERLLKSFENYSASFEPDLTSDDGMARLDICYVLHSRSRKYQIADAAELKRYLEGLIDAGHLIYAWLCGELAFHCGVDVRVKAGIRPFKGVSRLHDLYWVTHQFLLATRYLQRPLPKIGWGFTANELIESIPWIIDERYVDLGAEIALCLQLADKRSAAGYQTLIEFIAGRMRKDGAVVDPAMDESADNIAHTTAASMLVFAGIEEKDF